MSSEISLATGYISEKALVDAYLDLDKIDPEHQFFLGDKELIAIILANLKNAVLIQLDSYQDLPFFTIRHPLKYGEQDIDLTVIGYREQPKKTNYFVALFNEQEFQECINILQQEAAQYSAKMTPEPESAEPEEPDTDD